MRRLGNVDNAVASKGPNVFYQFIPSIEPRFSTNVELGFNVNNTMELTQSRHCDRSDIVRVEIARSFLQFTKRDNGEFDRLGRYEACLWRQLAHTMRLIVQIDESNRDRFSFVTENYWAWSGANGEPARYEIVRPSAARAAFVSKFSGYLTLL